ncbi:MAG TPA: hypothetical protein VN633_06015 [Bryobacteraceae bacterium]|nr:hypothetical protein [Bryobacteraceae bacterium]
MPAQQKIRELTQSALSKANLDFAKLERLYRESISEFAVEKKKRLSEAMKQSAALLNAFQSDLKIVQVRLDAIKEAAPVNLTLLDVATSITSDNLTLSATNMAHTNNQAEFDFNTDSTGSADVKFSYQWTNNSDLFAVINLLGFISFNGILTAGTDGSFWPIDTQHSHASLTAFLRVTNLQSGAVVAQGSSLFGPTLNVDTGGGWFGNPGAIDTEAVFRGLPPDLGILTVAPQTGLQIDVVGQFSADIDSGSADFNFQGDGRQVTSAGVIVSIVS